MSLESGNFPLVIGKRFTPHVANVIFNMLDKQALVKSRSVSSVWKDVVDSQTSLWTDPALYIWAAYEGELDICQKIIERVDNKNPSVGELPANSVYGRTTQCNSTPLHMAAMHGHVQICRLIMGHLEDKNPKNIFGDENTPLHETSTVEVFQLIMGETADKNPKNKRGRTPLHACATFGPIDICQLILETVDGKERNPADEEGTTPLHLAARNGKIDIFRLIFEHVSEKNPADAEGNTPLHYAATHNERYAGASHKFYLDICQLILDNVVDKHPLNNLGHTPLDLTRGLEQDEEPNENERHARFWVTLSDEERLEVENLWQSYEEEQELAE